MSMRGHYENLDQYAVYDYKDVANAYGHGEWDAIDGVLEIIDRHIVIQEMKHTEANNILHEIIAEIRATELKEIRNEILALKGGEKE